LKKLEAVFFGWILIISVLGGTLFGLSYIEDEREAKEKEDLEKQLSELVVKIGILEDRTHGLK